MVKVKFSGVARIINGQRKSFQKKTKAKTPTAANAGLERGRMICMKMRQREAPSIKAASSYSLGMLIKNWRSKKMFHAEANQWGIIKGHNVSSQLRCRQMMN